MEKTSRRAGMAGDAERMVSKKVYKCPGGMAMRAGEQIPA